MQFTSKILVASRSKKWEGDDLVLAKREEIDRDCNSAFEFFCFGAPKFRD